MLQLCAAFCPPPGNLFNLQSTPSVREKHFPALDGLRGLAALMIVAFHAAASYPVSNVFAKGYLRATSPLWIGVDLFFVLSGFLITNILLNTRNSTNYFTAFYGRRFARIFPLYYLFLAGTYFIVPMLGAHLPAKTLAAEPWEWCYAGNFYTAKFGWPDTSIAQLWTLAIEEQFYLVWPLVIWLFSRPTLKTGIVFALLAFPFLRAATIVAGFPGTFTYMFTLCHLDGLLAGALLSVVIRERGIGALEEWSQRRWFKTLDRLLLFSGALLFAIYCFWLGNQEFIFNFFLFPAFVQCTYMTALAFVFGFIVLRAIMPDANIWRRVLNLKWLRRAGKYSYAIYIFNEAICTWVGSSLPVPALFRNLPPSWNFIENVYFIVVEFALSIGAAVISWNVLEKHFLKLKKYFPYKRAVFVLPNGEGAMAGSAGIS